MICTVTLNPSLDYEMHVDDFKEGCVNRSSKEDYVAGGKGIMVSRMLNNLGYKSKILGFCGGFVGKEVINFLIKNGLEPDFITVQEGCTRINVKVFGNKETEINGGGPVISSENIKELKEKIEALQAGDILVLAGSLPKGVDKDIYIQFLKYGKEKGIKVIVDTSGEQLREVLSHSPFLVKPNQFELGELFQVEIKTKEEALVYAKKLQELGARNVIVSMGGAGAVLLDEYGKEYKLDAPDCKVVNTVGAGDSMVAGFIAGYLQEQDYGKAFLWAVASGSATASSPVLGKKERVLELLEKCKK